MKKTVVLGASPNPGRASYIAVGMLKEAGYEVIPIGIRSGTIEGIEIINSTPRLEGVDTVTLYLNPRHQEQYYDYILSLQPNRIIFNPGTENPVLARLAAAKNIETEVACTLVMVRVGIY